MLSRCARGWAKITRRHRCGAQMRHAIQRFVQSFHDAGIVQHIQRTTGTLNRLFASQHIRPARCHQHHVAKAHGFHRPRRCAHVAGVAGVDENEAGFHAVKIGILYG